MTARPRAHLERLAHAARPAGSAAERAARGYCAVLLRQQGFAVRDEPFEYSAFPGRAGTPLAGTAALLMFGAAGHAGFHGRPGVALAVLGGMAGAIAIAAWWLTVHGVLRCPWQRTQGTNLVAVRGAPALWLVAHLDSKSQPVPIAARALGVMVCGAAWVASVAVAGAQLAGARPPTAAWPLLTVLGVLGAIPVALSLVRDRSAGAVDNASGVAAVLTVAEAAAPEQGLGVLLTSAEELGLAGARAWAASGAHGPGSAINFDGLDDVGGARLTYGGRGYEALVEALSTALEREGMRVRNGRLVPGVLLDGVALAREGWRVVTVSRGTVGTVGRVHTARDNLGHLSGEGVSAVARATLAALEAVR